MNLALIKDKEQIHSFLRKNAELQIYCIGDLDDFFWPDTTWYGLIENDNIFALALLYSGMEIPTLLMFHDNEQDHYISLLELIKPVLPVRFYAHLSPGLMGNFELKQTDYFGLHIKMSLTRTPTDPDDMNIRRLTEKDLPAIHQLYLEAYPLNWFDRRMLGTGKYFGYFDRDKLTGISGIHVYSAKYRVAALGNIATHPDYRGRQIGYKLTMKLCHDLRQSVDLIGLNVKADNEYAIRSYKKAGFEIVGNYDECLIDLER